MRAHELLMDQALECGGWHARDSTRPDGRRVRRTNVRLTRQRRIAAVRPLRWNQNQNFAASCTTRGSSAVVIVPKLAGPSCAAGAPKFVVFSRLNTSRRSSIARSPLKPTRRITAKSTSRYEGPRTGLRDADPIVNGLAVANAVVLNQ